MFHYEYRCVNDDEDVDDVDDDDDDDDDDDNESVSLVEYIVRPQWSHIKALFELPTAVSYIKFDQSNAK